ncbi:phosphate system positive regulatory protein pho81 [Cladochytrium tenue]|nr:phosphate system positive regulatory protein pho81 [Cladochytrium tenue]
MKFGKFLQSQQTEWGGSHHINYKALKKVINAVEALTPAPSVAGTAASATTVVPSSSTVAASADRRRFSQDAHASTQARFQALKTEFFFKLERELEKVNAFYVQKEQEFKVRLRSLLDKKRILQARGTSQRNSASFENIREAFLQFQQDLAKLQNFVEINATGFRKILKKWDKRAKSTTKEFYLTRQVDIQPVFNKEVLAELTDVVTTTISELDALLDASNSQLDPSVTVKIAVEATATQKPAIDYILDVENDLVACSLEGHVDSVRDFLRKIGTPSNGTSTKIREEDPSFLSRVFLRVCDEASVEVLGCLLDDEFFSVDCNFADDISTRTCVHEAAIRGRLEVIELCVDRGKASIDVADSYGRLPTHYAAMYGHDQCLLYLLKSSIASASGNPESAVAAIDVDDNTPLTYAVAGGHARCVEILLDHGASVEVQQSESGTSAGPSPLSLACEYGHIEIATLLLRKGASLRPPGSTNNNGANSSSAAAASSDASSLPPLHLSARRGHASLCRLLIAHGADVDEVDPLTGWTPIFFAASEGHVESVEVLLAANCRVDIKDEIGWLPWTYALYRGHIEAAALLETGLGDLAVSSPVGVSPPAVSTTASAVAGPPEMSPLASPLTPLGAGTGLAISSVASPQPIAPASVFSIVPRVTGDTDGGLGGSLGSAGSLVGRAGGGSSALDDDIPTLSLPPPMIPFRIYGHNYLEGHAYLEVRLGGDTSSSAVKPAVESAPIKLFGSQKLSSYRLVITSRPDSIPYNVILPGSDDAEVYPFFVDGPAEFGLQFEVYPTFGTKALGKAAVLPSQFALALCGGGELSGSSNVCGGEDVAMVAPLFDSHLKVVGEIRFNVSLVTAFSHPNLRIGGTIETYWKSTKVVSSTKPHGAAGEQSVHSFITATSMASEYLRLTVQLTRDGVPVVYSRWRVPVAAAAGGGDGGLALGVHELTLAQAGALLRGRSRHAALEDGSFWESDDVARAEVEGLRSAAGARIAKVLALSAVPLAVVLKHLPTTIGVVLDLRHPTPWQRQRLGLPDVPTVNQFVDAVLQVVYDGATGGGRPILFASFSPAVCAAASWKQPNYGILFATHAGFSDGLDDEDEDDDGEDEAEGGEHDGGDGGDAAAAAGERRRKRPRRVAAAGVVTGRDPDRRCSSIKEALRFARRSKFLGIICEATPLVR